jgi:HEPN domain-containing protein
MSSKYDFEVARSLFDSGHYIYTLFMCHLAVEKLLKAIVAESQEEMPPKLHNLIRLSELGQLVFPDEFRTFIEELNNVSIPTRYPENFVQLSKRLNKAYTRKCLSQTE